MKYQILFVTDGIEDDRLRQFVDAINELVMAEAGNDPIVRRREAVILETDLEDIGNLLLKSKFGTIYNLNMIKKPRTPTGKCAKCFKVAVLVKESGLCLPCQMQAAKERKRMAAEAALKMVEEPKKNKRAHFANNAEIQANVEKVVAAARERGTVGGGNLEKTERDLRAGSSLKVRKLG